MKISNSKQLKLNFEENNNDSCLEKDDSSLGKTDEKIVLTENVDYSFDVRLNKKINNTEQDIYKEIIMLASHI